MIATSLSGLAVCIACGTNKLVGTASCYSEFTCTSGELCRDQVVGPAGDSGTESGCVTATITGRYLSCSY